MAKPTYAALLGILFLTGGCFNNPTFDDYEQAAASKAAGTVDLPNEATSFCVKFTQLRLSGDFNDNVSFSFAEREYDSRLYGRVCTISSEDPNLTRDGAATATRLTNCQNLFFEKDDDPFASNFVVSLANEFSDIFKDATVTEIMAMYDDDSATQATNKPTRRSKGNYPFNVTRTIKVKDVKNHRILVVFLPIADDDGAQDDVFANADDITNQEYGNDYPIILQFRDSEIPKGGGPAKKSQTLADWSKPSFVTFDFEVRRNACTP